MLGRQSIWMQVEGSFLSSNNKKLEPLQADVLCVIGKVVKTQEKTTSAELSKHSHYFEAGRLSPGSR